MLGLYFHWQYWLFPLVIHYSDIVCVHIHQTGSATAPTDFRSRLWHEQFIDSLNWCPYFLDLYHIVLANNTSVVVNLVTHLVLLIWPYPTWAHEVSYPRSSTCWWNGDVYEMVKTTGENTQAGCSIYICTPKEIDWNHGKRVHNFFHKVTFGLIIGNKIHTRHLEVVGPTSPSPYNRWPCNFGNHDRRAQPVYPHGGELH